jgi:hypothetical protein
MKGMGRRRLEQMHPTTELGIDLLRVPKIAGMPRYMYGSALRDSAGYLRALARRDLTGAVRHEMMLWYFAGYARASLSGAPPSQAAECVAAAS